MPRIDKVILTTSACVVALLFLVGCTATRTISQTIPIWRGEDAGASCTTQYSETSAAWLMSDVDLNMRAKSDDSGTSITSEVKTSRASEVAWWSVLWGEGVILAKILWPSGL
jgi:hypothetical protein